MPKTVPRRGKTATDGAQSRDVIIALQVESQTRICPLTARLPLGAKVVARARVAAPPRSAVACDGPPHAPPLALANGRSRDCSSGKRSAVGLRRDAVNSRTCWFARAPESRRDGEELLVHPAYSALIADLNPHRRALSGCDLSFLRQHFDCGPSGDYRNPGSRSPGTSPEIEVDGVSHSGPDKGAFDHCRAILARLEDRQRCN